MKLLRYSLAVPTLFSASPALAASITEYFPVCTQFKTPAGKELVVDPSSPNKDRFRDLDSAIKAANEGDTIALMTGDYGDLKVVGKNSDRFITISAAPGQTPKFTKISVKGSHWRLKGLTVSSFQNGLYGNGSTAHNPLIAVGDSDNIILENNIINSQPGQLVWEPEIHGVASPKAVSQGIFSVQSTCISITGNRISNVWNGISVGGDQKGDRGKYFLLNDNEIDNFASDGIDHSVSHLRIENNRITNAHDICDNKCTHGDGIQGWNWNNWPGLLNTDITIINNQIVVQTRPDLPMPADGLQGITIFNGNWDGVRILNNVAVVSAYHGITVYGARNVSIINNTVVPTVSSHHSWIMTSGGKDIPPGAPNILIIRNNIAAEISVNKADLAQGLGPPDHNLKVRDIGDFEDVFVKFDLKNFTFDFHPSKKSDAKGEGSADGAPAADIEGRSRKAPIDIGAYSYSGS